MRARLVALSVTIGSFLPVPRAAAEPVLLGSASFPISACVFCGLSDPAFGIALYPEEGPPVYMFRQTFSQAPTGTVLVATASNEPAFRPFARLLADGSPNTIEEWFAYGAFGTSESGLFASPYGFGPNGKPIPFGQDFAGHVITRLTLHVDDAFLSDDRTVTSLAATLNVFGEPVPEPATLSLVGIGLAVVGARWRRRAGRRAGGEAQGLPPRAVES